MIYRAKTAPNLDSPSRLHTSALSNQSTVNRWRDLLWPVRAPKMIIFHWVSKRVAVLNMSLPDSCIETQSWTLACSFCSSFLSSLTCPSWRWGKPILCRRSNLIVYCTLSMDSYSGCSCCCCCCCCSNCVHILAIWIYITYSFITRIP